MRKIKPGSDSGIWQKPASYFQNRESDPGLMKNKKAAGFAAGGFFSIAAQRRCRID
jgi:hypothetical protein